ncbi:hypothetical protein NXS19_003541 [Fusarium pseudograminearum]|nr:hypothetical protein NXS19_003541 [Fusarium pseudograminearum]
MSDPFAPRSMKRKNVKGLALKAAAPRPPPTAETSNHEYSGSQDAGRDEQLEIGIEYKLDLRPEDLEILKELGSGNGGTVSKVKHITTGTVMARKVIHVEAKREIRKRIVRELQIMHGCHSDYIVTFYGAFLTPNNDVIMCMEYMDVGALDRVSRVFGPVRVDVLGKIAEATLGGLTYLYTKHHIMHRDIKPSNILVNSRGGIKLCDFGVSGELVNSIADTFVGTSTYMAPERIQGEKYTVKSDVWSFGLSIMELAIGKFPFAASEQVSDGDFAPAGILDLLQQIVHEPAPKLPKSDAFPSILDDMIQKCLYKEPERRPTPQELFDRDHFVQAAKRTPVDLREWAVGMMERDNRKSHLAPSSLLQRRTSFDQAILLPNRSRLKLRHKPNPKSVHTLPLQARFPLAVLVSPPLATNTAQTRTDHRLETDMHLPERRLPHILGWDLGLLPQIPSPRFRVTPITSAQ